MCVVDIRRETTFPRWFCKLPTLLHKSCDFDSQSVFVYLGKEWKRVSKSSKYPPFCSEWSNEHSVQLSCRCKSHLRCQTAEGFKSSLDTFTDFQVVLLFSEVIKCVLNLQLTGSVLDDTWKESGKPHMEQLIQRIENILLDATCSRFYKQLRLM